MNVPSFPLTGFCPRAVLCFCLLVTLAGCSRERIDPAQPEEEWVFGEITTTPVVAAPGDEYPEPISGGAIVFPDGGAGTLRTAEILGGPQAPFPGAGIFIEYDGDDRLFLRLPPDAGESVMLGWGVSSGSIGGVGAAEDRWISLERIEDDGGPAFLLCQPFENTRRSSRRGYTKHHIASIPTGSNEEARLAAIRQQANTDVQSWLTALPSNLSLRTRNRVNANPLTFYADDNYYIGFVRYRWGTYPSPRMGLHSNSTAGNTAHEVGHYMHHMLLSDELYLQLENAAPDNHGIGDIHPGRPSIGEDVAYFSQFLLRGGVGNYDPTEPAFMLQNRHPHVDDFPSVEGLACCLLARLWSTDPTIAKFGDRTVRLPIPTVGASMADLLSLIALGAGTIDELREDVATYLAGRGQSDRLPVILERIGWRYIARARLVDQDGNPLRNVTVRKYAVSNLVEYVPTTEFGITDDDGYLQETYVFPMDSYLRVEHLGQTFDLPIYVDPSRPTNQAVDLGTLTVGNALDLSLAQYGKIELRLYGSFNDTGGQHDDWITLSSYGWLTGSLAGDVFTGAADYVSSGYHYVLRMEVTVNPASGAISSFEYQGDATSTGSGDNEHVEFAGGGVPMVAYEHGENTVFYQATLTGGTVCGAVTGAERTTTYGGSPGWMTDYSCSGPSGVAQIKIQLSTERTLLGGS